MNAKIVIVSGACGTGKSTLARLLAENSPCPRTVHMHTDDFYQYICNGYIAPWMEDSGDQNETVINAVVAAASCFLADGYEVYVDGVIGPWFLEPWIKLALAGSDIRYLVLRPDEESTVLRASEREPRDCFPLSDETVKKMWHCFADLGEYEPHAIDTTGQTASQSAALIREHLRNGAFRIG